MVGSVYSEVQEVKPDPKTLQKYQEERNKRFRQDGLAQFIDLDKTERFKYLDEDPFVDHDALNAQEPVLKDGSECQVLIYGAGYGGLVFAVRLIQAGFRAEDIVIVDTAGGYGGTWYWNRYPGLMCDVESYVYMPLLEETGYMPKHKYAYQPELRAHADRIAEQWRLQALFRTKVDSQIWDEGRKQWRLGLTENRGPGKGKQNLQVHANFVVMTGGLLPVPHIPKLDGLEDFKGEHFHTARWNWNVSGGSEHDQRLINLHNKTVGLIGTGATAVQLIPELAKYAKQLHVFQRTPSSCDTRGQRATTRRDWAAITANNTRGWQAARSHNFNQHVRHEAPAGVPNLVDDGWTRMPGYLTVLGSGGAPLAPADVPAHVARMHALDLPRAERLRARVAECVADPATAASLQAWYACWCKRPCFHDEFLPAFNRPNVRLVDTHGRGVERLAERGVVAEGAEVPVDVLVFATGYRPPMPGSPALNANVEVVGREGLDMDEKWERVGAATLHGVVANGFPNCFVWSPTQTGLAPNAVAVIDFVAKHTAYIIEEARKRVGGAEKFAVQATREAEEAWATESAMRAGWFAPLVGCTPGYLNKEGLMDKMAELSPEEQFKQGRAAHWGGGWVDYTEKIMRWKEDGGLKGLEVWTW